MTGRIPNIASTTRWEPRAAAQASGTSRTHGYLGPLRELQTVRLPDNTVMLDVLAPAPSDYSCGWEISAVSPEATAWNASLAGPYSYYLTPHGRDTVFTNQFAAQQPTLEAVATAAWWAGTFFAFSIVQNDFYPRTPQVTSWKSTAGEFAINLAEANNTLFFSTQLSHVAYQALAWDPDGGLRTVLPHPNAAAGGAGSLVSDGTDMVWLEGTDYDDANDAYGTMTLMTSPFATRAEDVKPRALRTVNQNSPTGATPRIGGGYAFLWEESTPSNGRIVTITRLSDGAYWVIPDVPGGYSIAWHLYIDSEEFAYVLNAPPGTFTDGGIGYGEGGQSEGRQSPRSAPR